jgi:hypothetical protein
MYKLLYLNYYNDSRGLYFEFVNNIMHRLISSAHYAYILSFKHCSSHTQTNHDKQLSGH